MRIKPFHEKILRFPHRILGAAVTVLFFPGAQYAADVVSRQTLDLNGNGKIDQIQITFDENVNNDCTGLSITVTDYSVLGIADCNNESDAKIVILLQEKSEECRYSQTDGCDTGHLPPVQIVSNTSLEDTGETLVSTDPSPVTPTDGAAPAMTGVRATVGQTTLIVNFSESVGAQSGATGQIPSSVFAYNDVNKSGASALAGQSGAAGQTISYTLDAAFTESDHFTDRLAIESDSVFDAAGNTNKARNTILVDRTLIGFVTTGTQAYPLGAQPSAAPTLTIRNSVTADKITAEADIRIRIPDSLTLLWDETATSPSVLGSAAERISTVPSFEDGGRTVVFDVIEDLQPGETLVISDLQLKEFTRVSGPAPLELVVADNTVVQGSTTIRVYEPPTNPLANAKAVPNYLQSGQGQIRLVNLEGKVRIRIYTARGRQIADFTRQSSDGGVTLRPVGNSGRLRTGVYSIVITDSNGNRKVLKLVAFNK